MLQRWRHARRCRRLAEECQLATLSRYLKDCAELKIGDIGDTPMIAADLELTGFEAGSDQIVAMGWTLLDQGRIRMGSSRHLLINAQRPVGSSAAIHELTDTEVAGGESLETGLEALFEAAQGRVWVFHHAGLDVAFLKQACGRWARVLPGFIVLDTMRIEFQLRRRRNIPLKNGDLQLATIRSHYGLPRYTAHNALNDALATAELMLAIASHLAPSEPLQLAPLLKYF